MELAKEARHMLDEAALHSVRIFASGGLDELDIDHLVRGGAPIDAFGVGTRLGVSADAPYLDTVYKLVAFGGRPVLKLSPGKATAPGAKQVFRRKEMKGGIVGLRHESPPVGTRPLMGPVMVAGRRATDPQDLAAARARFEADLEDLPGEARDLLAPVPPPVEFSAALRRLMEQATAEVGLGGGDTPAAR